MIRGFGQKRIEYRDGIEIVLADHEREVCYTIQFTAHAWNPGFKAQTTLLDGEEKTQIARAIGEALQQVGLLPASAVDTELKATKYHLEDMRKLVFVERESGEGE